MSSQPHVPPSSTPTRPRQPSAAFWALLGFLAIAGFFLFTEHRAHVFGVLPYLLLLACPFMHFFMHRGHDGGHAGHGGARPGPEDPEIRP